MQKRILRAISPRGSPPARLPFWPSRALPHFSCPAFSPACSRPPQQGYCNFFGYQSQPAEARRPQAPRARRHRRSRKRRRPRRKPRRAAPSSRSMSSSRWPTSVPPSMTPTASSRRSRVSTGQPGHSTPPGVYSVIGRERYHHSTIYSGAPMPWMQRITWSGVAMHAGVVPGYPASHGCIRLPYTFAPQMSELNPHGIARDRRAARYRPAAISHPFLPLPKMQTAPTTLAAAETPTHGNVELASLSTPRRPPRRLPRTAGQSPSIRSSTRRR